MPEFRTIEIDFEVHKRIEAERQSFDESANEVLRRLLSLGQPAANASIPKGRSWFGLDVELPHGTELRMTYNGVVHEGVIDDGSWLAEGQRYSSPSGAAKGVARTKSGGRTNLDGWGYWYARKPASDKWVPISALWHEAQAKKTA